MKQTYPRVISPNLGYPELSRTLEKGDVEAKIAEILACPESWPKQNSSDFKKVYPGLLAAEFLAIKAPERLMELLLTSPNSVAREIVALGYRLAFRDTLPTAEALSGLAKVALQDSDERVSVRALRSLEVGINELGNLKGRMPDVVLDSSMVSSLREIYQLLFNSKNANHLARLSSRSGVEIAQRMREMKEKSIAPQLALMHAIEATGVIDNEFRVDCAWRVLKNPQNVQICQYALNVIEALAPERLIDAQVTLLLHPECPNEVYKQHKAKCYSSNGIPHPKLYEAAKQILSPGFDDRRSPSPIGALQQAFRAYKVIESLVTPDHKNLIMRLAEITPTSDKDWSNCDVFLDILCDLEPERAYKLAETLMRSKSTPPAGFVQLCWWAENIGNVLPPNIEQAARDVIKPDSMITAHLDEFSESVVLKAAFDLLLESGCEIDRTELQRCRNKIFTSYVRESE